MRSFDYDLPAELIAQRPAEPRSSSRLLDATSLDGTIRHLRVDDLPQLLGPGDLLVLNDTKVLPARLVAHKLTGAKIEVLLLEQREPDTWEALVKPGRKVRRGSRLVLDGVPAVEVGGPCGDRGQRLVRLLEPQRVMSKAGIALPPYVHGELDDPARYQTVYARSPGSVAAPTAGLHLTHELLDRCRAAGASVATLDLAIGMATFAPITSARPEDHEMHSERYRVPEATMEACESASRVVAVGTTTVRALESAALTGRLHGRTSLFIHGDFEFKVVDVLLTNFHMPRSSLLMMLDSFCGPRWRDLYDVARRSGYRFLSFGDAMVVSKRPAG